MLERAKMHCAATQRSDRRLADRRSERGAVGSQRPGLSARLGRGLLVALALLWATHGGLPPLARGADEFPEYQLKAAFLFQFAKFVTWPDKVFADAKTPLTIGTLGTDPFGPLLRNTVAGKTVNGRQIAIKPLSREDEVKGCHILFISRSEKDRLPQVLAALKGQSILTVSEVERFAHTGGMVNFVLVSQSVRFELSLQAAEQAGLQVSSKLAGVAILVKPESPKEGN